MPSLEYLVFLSFVSLGSFPSVVTLIRSLRLAVLLVSLHTARGNSRCGGDGLNVVLITDVDFSSNATRRHKAGYRLYCYSREHVDAIILRMCESEESIEYYVNSGKVRGDGTDRINNEDRHRDTLCLCCFTFDSRA